MAKGTNKSLFSGLDDAGKQVRAQWETKDLEWKRAVLGLVIDHVAVAPAVGGRASFDPSAITVKWKF